ncbi:MAG: mannan endo-1,4-beta-mannosidase [Planctomycetes bacterium]|nr:mannan endo-1,4-beta-mannosidase [Planctomycetota bacterium]
MTRFAAFAAACLFASSSLAQNYRYEAENAQVINGVDVRSTLPGYSGTGYITNIHDSTDYFEMNVAVPTGLYELWVGYRSEFSQKGYRYRVGDQYGNGMLDQSFSFAADRAGLFNLSGGTSTLGIYKDWGWHEVDYLEFRPFTPPTVLPVSAQLSDPQADANTQHLMNYMTSIYGQKTLAGHQHDESKNLPFPSSTYLNLSGGVKPALRSSDFMEYSPSRRAAPFNANPRNESEESIAWARANGGVMSMTWHWNAPANLVNSSEWPWWSGFYTQATTFNLPAALANPAGSDYQLILRDIDAIAVELQKFENAGVPVIWRPLHEAQGGWFWWGAHGPETFKSLWRLMHSRLTNQHGLHNLIWEFTSSAAIGNHLQWYPGDDVVDMIGLDIYTDPTSSMSGEWYDVLAHYNGRKMIALSESGTLPNADLMELYGIDWSYFSLWKDEFLDDFTAQQVQALLNDENIITEKELPLLPWSAVDYNRDGEVGAADYAVWRKLTGMSGANLAADGNLSEQVNAADYTIWRNNFGRVAFGNSGSGSSAFSSVPEPAAGLLMLSGVLCLFFGSRKGAKAQRLADCSFFSFFAP